jgi:hypothetical protein
MGGDIILDSPIVILGKEQDFKMGVVLDKYL